VFVKGRATNSYQGSFFEAQALRELVAKEAALAPILLHFQPFVWKPGIQGGFKLAEGRHDLEGVPCVIIRRDKKDPHPQAPVVTESLWLDPAQQFSIRRHTLETGGKVYRQLDMQYRPDGAIPIPAAWQSVSRNAAGELTLSIKATVTSRKVNEDIPDAEFTITFPSGTRILTMP
jgi:hypothetical protein